MRALIVAAGKTLDEAESLAAAVGPKSVAQVQEQRGDLLAMEERWESASDWARRSLRIARSLQKPKARKGRRGKGKPKR